MLLNRRSSIGFRSFPFFFFSLFNDNDCAERKASDLFLHFPTSIRCHRQLGQKKSGVSDALSGAARCGAGTACDCGARQPLQGHGGSNVSAQPPQICVLHSKHCRIDAVHRRRWSPGARLVGQKTDKQPCQRGIGCILGRGGRRGTELGSGVGEFE